MRDSAGNEERSRRLTSDDIKALYQEWNVSRQSSTGNGALIHQFAEGVPPWFPGAELGLAFGAGPSIITTVFGAPEFDIPSLRDANRDARVANRKRQNDKIKAALARSPSKVLRARLKPIDEPRGCTGCPSCVPDARLRPRRSIHPTTISRWTPGSLSRPLREQEAVVKFLRAGAAAVRRAQADDRSAAFQQRKQRAAAAREQMKARRADQKGLRATVRRAAARVLSESEA